MDDSQIQEIVEGYNKKLRDHWGQNLTLEIVPFFDDDDIVRFYFHGSTIEESDWYDSIEECFKSANEYLDFL